VSHAPRTATVTALEEGEVLRIEADDLGPFLTAYPALRVALERARDERAKDTIEKVLGRVR
jgi:CRP-like cAMP-binding protein